MYLVCIDFKHKKGMLSIVLYMYLFCIKLAIFQIFLAILYKIGIPFLYPQKCTNFVPFFGVGDFRDHFEIIFGNN